MKSSWLLLSNIFLASNISAAPDGWSYLRSARSRLSESLHSVPSMRANIKDNRISGPLHNNTWAGGILPPVLGGDIYGEVEAQFAIPTISVPNSTNGYWATAVWVGIDGFNYKAAAFQVGVTLELAVNSGVAQKSYTAWYEWFPGSRFYLDLSINAGDEIYIMITTSSSTEGNVMIENISTGTIKTYDVKAQSSKDSIPGLNVEWIMESYERINGPWFSLPNFGVFNFSVCRAIAGETVVDLARAKIVDISAQNGVNLTQTSIPDEHTVKIVYLGSG